MEQRVSADLALLQPGHRALRKGRVSLAGHTYLVAGATWHRQPSFADFAAGSAAARCFDVTYLLGDANMLAWVLMPDHVHWLIGRGAVDPLGTVVNRLKSASARGANRALRRGGSLWAPAFHDHALRTDENLIRGARYIVANPVRAGLVAKAGDDPF